MVTRLSSVRTGSEQETIAAILAGNTQLYHELIRPHERSVYLMALSYLENEEDAEDVAQETFIRAYRKLSAFRGESRFSTWLISIALNESRNRLRRRANLRIESLDDARVQELPASPVLLRDWRELPSDILEREEVRGLIQKAVGKLPAIYREVFVLREIEELDVNETASVLNISASLVKVRLHRARIMLQTLLAPQLSAVGNGAKRRWHSWF